jgi:hypothetical protein
MIRKANNYSNFWLVKNPIIKTPYSQVLVSHITKQRYIAGSAKCSTKPLSKLLTCILSEYQESRISFNPKNRNCLIFSVRNCVYGTKYVIKTSLIWSIQLQNSYLCREQYQNLWTAIEPCYGLKLLYGFHFLMITWSMYIP